MEDVMEDVSEDGGRRTEDVVLIPKNDGAYLFLATTHLSLDKLNFVGDYVGVSKDRPAQEKSQIASNFSD